MRVNRRLGAVLVLVLIAGGLAAREPRRLIRDAVAYVLAPSPHDRYAALLRLRRAAETPAGQAWLHAADAALTAARDARAPLEEPGTFDEQSPLADAWRFRTRRGQRIIVDVDFRGGPIFVDLFGADGHERLASAPLEDGQLVYDADQEREVVLRVQPALARGGPFHVTARSVGSLGFPVQGLTPHAVQSSFGTSRDAGRRRHEGIDIFAPKGTSVIAASDGWIGGSTANGLGGNVVWVWNPIRRLRTYYAHLDRLAVLPGTRVHAGDVVGYVGNTGNARGGPPHLHFGVYVPGGSVDPLPYICDAPCGMR